MSFWFSSSESVVIRVLMKVALWLSWVSFVSHTTIIVFQFGETIVRFGINSVAGWVYRGNGSRTNTGNQDDARMPAKGAG